MAILKTNRKKAARDTLVHSKLRLFLLMLLATGLISTVTLRDPAIQLSEGLAKKVQRRTESMKPATKVLAPVRSVANTNSAAIAIYPSNAVDNDVLRQNDGAEIVSDIAREYVRQKRSVFFSKDVLAQNLLARDEAAIQHLKEYLSNIPDVEDAQDSVDSQARIAERMAALDLVGWLSVPDAAAKFGPEVQEEALMALRSIFNETIPAWARSGQRKVMVAEKYDALVALVHSHQESAIEAYRALGGEKQRRVMLPALMTGLIDSGIARANMDAEITRLLGASHSSLTP